jgi:hypothetical protein
MTEPVTAYRIVEMKNGVPHTLFHGLPLNGTRTRKIPIGTWIEAEEKEVSYGKGSPPMISGFNVLLDKELCLEYLTRFTGDRELRVVEVLVRDLRPKPRAQSPVFLAKSMMLPETSI